MSSLHEIFSSKLREALGKSKTSQRALADKMDTTTTTVQRWLTMQAWPSPEKIEEMADHLNVTVSFLMGGSNSNPTRAEITLECINLINSIKDIELAKQALGAILEGEALKPQPVQKKS